MKKLVMTVCIAAAAILAYLYFRPLPEVSAVSTLTQSAPAQAVNLAWPAQGQAAIGAMGYGLLASRGAQQAVPIASVSKIITAYAVLRQRPLGPGQQGPTITLDNTDLGYFNYYYTNGGSDTNVAVGEKITEYQALQALLLPSSNNMADSLARWAFGSTSAYVAYANQMVKRMGLTDTIVGGASGFNDKTMSSAEDLVKIGEAALKSPVIADIVSQQTATIPVEGIVSNVNELLGAYGINGIKTGNTDEAGGCYLFASQQTISGQTVELVGAVLDQASLAKALAAAPPLINSARAGFNNVTAIKKGQMLGYYQAPWGAKAGFVSSGDASMLAWQGVPLQISSATKPLRAPVSSGTQAGTVTVKSGAKAVATPLALSQNLPAPSLWWRLFRR